MPPRNDFQLLHDLRFFLIDAPETVSMSYLPSLLSALPK